MQQTSAGSTAGQCAGVDALCNQLSCFKTLFALKTFQSREVNIGCIFNYHINDQLNIVYACCIGISNIDWLQQSAVLLCFQRICGRKCSHIDTGKFAHFLHQIAQGEFNDFITNRQGVNHTLVPVGQTNSNNLRIVILTDDGINNALIAQSKIGRCVNKGIGNILNKITNGSAVSSELSIQRNTVFSNSIQQHAFNLSIELIDLQHFFFSQIANQVIKVKGTPVSAKQVSITENPTRPPRHTHIHQGSEVIGAKRNADYIGALNFFLILFSSPSNDFIIASQSAIMGIHICLLKLPRHIPSAVIVPINLVIGTQVQQVVHIFYTKAGCTHLRKLPAKVLSNLERCRTLNLVTQETIPVHNRTVFLRHFIALKTVTVGHRVAEEDILLRWLFCNFNCEYAGGYMTNQQTKRQHHRQTRPKHFRIILIHFCSSQK